MSAATDQTPEVPANKFDCFEMSAQILREGTARRESSQDPSVIKGAQRGIDVIAAATCLQIRLKWLQPNRQSRHTDSGGLASERRMQEMKRQPSLEGSVSVILTHTHIFTVLERENSIITVMSTRTVKRLHFYSSRSALRLTGRPRY